MVAPFYGEPFKPCLTVLRFSVQLGSMNVLAKWLDRNGGAAGKRRLLDLLREKTGATLRWQTIDFIARGKATPRASTARLIEQATGGEVSAAALLGVRVDDDVSAAE